MPHWASRPLNVLATSGMARRCLSQVLSVTSMNSETALETMWVTRGSSQPATAAIMKLIDPWQWTTALRGTGRRARPASASHTLRILRTASGWSCMAAWSRVYSLGGRSIDARHVSTHTS